MAQKYSAVVILGKNWKWTEKKDNGCPPLSLESRMSAETAVFFSGLADKIIFSTGKTAGKNCLSEARAMYNHVKNKLTIPNNNTILEEKSYDTSSNAEEIRSILREYDIHNEPIALITVGYHLERAKKLFGKYGMKVDCFPSEKIYYN